jgi:hypothetical protein
LNDFLSNFFQQRRRDWTSECLSSFPRFGPLRI